MAKPKIEQKTELGLSLSPQQLIKANILQLNSMMLETRLFQELESNPALEISELENDDLNEESTELDEQEEMDFEYENDDLAITNQSNKDMDITSNLKHQSSITDQVISILRDDNLSDNELKIAEEITGNLDDHGYLKIDPELIADRLKISNELVLDVIEKIKHSEFPGLASSSIQECLIAQLNVYEISSISKIILMDYFDDFINKRYDKLMGKIDCSKNELHEAISVIAQLNPNPRYMINEMEFNKDTIIPDVTIDKINNKWNITVNDANVPNVVLSDNYLNMYKDGKQDKDVKFFLKSKIESAQWFIDAIKARNKTIQSIVARIIVRQGKYFDSEKKELVPMILKDIAGDLNIDISTVSRATKEKYIQMPWGLKELKFFFSEGIASDKGKISSKNVKNELKNIIESEDKKVPYGDNALTELLNKQGIKIARRTVTKYREQLNYSTARLRRELK